MSLSSKILEDFLEKEDKYKYFKETDISKFLEVYKFIKPGISILEEYELRKKKSKRKEEEKHKSILEYARTWPEEIRKRAKEIINKAPKPPSAPPSPKFR